MRSRVPQKLAVTLFLAALLAPGAAVATSGHLRATVSAVVADPGSWPVQSNVLRNGTPLWNDAVSVYATTLFRAGASANPGFAQVGRDGWLFLGDVQNANWQQALGRRTYSDAEIRLWTGQIAQEQQWLARRGIPMVFVVGPAKWSIYPDKLPAWVTSGPPRTSIFDQVLAADPSLPLVDVRATLVSHRTTADTYSPLNSHWTDYGAAVAWSQIATSIEKVLPKAGALTTPTITSVTTVDKGNEFEATVGVRAANPWTQPVLATPLPDYQIVGADGSLTTMPGSAGTDLLDLPRTTKNTGAGNALTALVLRDSMGNSLSPYLQASFGTVVQVRHNIDDSALTPNVEAMVDLLHPDVVVYEMAERHFNSGLVDTISWLSANEFDLADAAGQHAWEQASPVGATLRVTGPQALTSRVNVSNLPTSTAGCVVRVSLLSGGAGQLEVAGDGVTAQDLRVAPDSNVLFATLPMCPANLHLQAVPGSASMSLTSVQVRPR